MFLFLTFFILNGQVSKINSLVEDFIAKACFYLI